MESGGIPQTRHNKKGGERNYTNEAQLPLNYPKLLMNLWTALMSALFREFKLAKKCSQSYPQT